MSNPNRYELVDREHPEWRGQRFASLERARREHSHAVPPGRFWIKDRERKIDVTTNDHEPLRVTPVRDDLGVEYLGAPPVPGFGGGGAPVPDNYPPPVDR